jgi:hypothetical protein
MLDECVTLTRAGVPISAQTIDRYAAELERLTRERAALRETLYAPGVSGNGRGGCLTVNVL